MLHLTHPILLTTHASGDRTFTARSKKSKVDTSRGRMPSERAVTVSPSKMLKASRT